MVRYRHRPKRRILVALNLRYGWERSVFRGISRYGTEQGDWSLWPRHGDFTLVPDLPKAPRKRMSDKEFDGALGVFHDVEHTSLISSLADYLVNTVGWDAEGAPPYVELDEAEIGRMAANFFLARGFRHFAFCSGYQQTKFATLRCHGFVERLQAAGLDADRWMAATDGPSMEQWLHELPKPVAIFGSNDLTGARIAKICVEQGIDVPEEVAVLGVDNDETICLFGGLPLSSIMVPHERLGYLAAMLLDRIMKGEPCDDIPRRLPPLHVINRISTEHLAVRDEVVKRSLQFIRERVEHGVQVQDICASLKVNRRSLERRFREQLGHSPAQEIMRARLDRAKELLLSTYEPIEIVAGKSGFLETRTFLRNFRKLQGMTPTEFRQRSETSI